MPVRRPQDKWAPISPPASSPVPLLRERNSSLSSQESSMPPRYAPHNSYQSVQTPPSQSSHTHANPFSDKPPQRRGHSYQFSLHPDPSKWGYDVSPKSIDEDDWIHKPDKNINDTGSIWTSRGIPTIGCIVLLIVMILGLFLGYPLQDAIRRNLMSKNGGYNLGGINATGQVFESYFSLVDKDTPQNVRTKASPVDGRTMQLVFSDEFNQDGRSFYPGDDPFWEAADLYYWGTQDTEYYDPKQVYTQDGKLVLKFEQAEPLDNHNQSFVGGMLTSWNKFCFTGGLIEVSVQLPGSPEVSGFWPAIWTMGNLGRAGYGATTEGMWPYSYEACDIGTVPNQTENGFPDAVGQELGDKYAGYHISFLPGQRLSSCTCPGEPHPGPVYKDGSYGARGVPEIDIFEAQIDDRLEAGAVSQSAQFAPFSAYYQWDNATYATRYQPDTQVLNSYPGGAYQQAASMVSKTNQGCYEIPPEGQTACYATYGFQYKPGFSSDGGQITWINDDAKSWKLDITGLQADPLTGVSDRMVSKEPMYIIMNLGQSSSFAHISDLIQYPATMKIDWIRIYQYEDAISYGCDPADHPTSNYINTFWEAYSNSNLTTWSLPAEEGGYNQQWPRNKRVTPCNS